MKKIVLIGLLFVWCGLAFAQKGEYKDGQFLVDGKAVAKVERTKDKENMGLTSTYEVLSPGGEKLLIAAYAGEFDQDPNNSLNIYYRFTFLTTNQVGIFPLSKLGAEKSLGKLLATSGIFADGKLDEAKVRELIAKKGKAPTVSIDYTIVSRRYDWPLKLEVGNSISQQDMVIGSFKDVTRPNANQDSYEFRLPTGVVVAEVSFTGSNNAQECQIYTLRDKNRRLVNIPSAEKIKGASTEVDRNQVVLKRITSWLVDNRYL